MRVNIGMPVVRTDGPSGGRTDGLSGGRAGGRSVYGQVITNISWMGSLPHFLTHGAP